MSAMTAEVSTALSNTLRGRMADALGKGDAHALGDIAKAARQAKLTPALAGDDAQATLTTLASKFTTDINALRGSRIATRAAKAAAKTDPAKAGDRIAAQLDRTSIERTLKTDIKMAKSLRKAGLQPDGTLATEVIATTDVTKKEIAADKGLGKHGRKEIAKMLDRFTKLFASK